jgi:hypothetical protein
MISGLGLQVGQAPVPAQYGQFCCSKLSATLVRVPEHLWHSPLPPQSGQCPLDPKAMKSPHPPVTVSEKITGRQ